MRVVFDTNVLLSSTLWQNSVAQKLLIALVKSDTQFFTSGPILSEFQKVLARDFHFSDEDIGTRTMTILSFTKLIHVPVEARVVPDDPEDDKIIACAHHCSADYIVTYDPHLLKVGKYESINILKPEELIQKINGRT